MSGQNILLANSVGSLGKTDVALVAGDQIEIDSCYPPLAPPRKINSDTGY